MKWDVHLLDNVSELVFDVDKKRVLPRAFAILLKKKKEGRASLVRRDGMHSNELAQNSL